MLLGVVLLLLHNRYSNVRDRALLRIVMSLASSAPLDNADEITRRVNAQLRDVTCNLPFCKACQQSIFVT